MKKTIALVLAFVCLVSLAGCVASQSSKTDNKILNAWAGEFSEENLKDAINMYEKKYTSVLVDDAGKGSSVLFEVDFDVTYCCVTRLSYVSKDDISAENKETAIEMLTEIKEKITAQKKPSIIKSALVGLKDFLIGVGASATVAIIQAKMQGLF